MVYFLKRIHSLSHSLDYIEEALFRNLTDSIDRYLNKKLKATYYTIIVDYEAQIKNGMDNIPSFTVVLSKGDKKKGDVMRIREENGDYRGQVSYAYVKGKNLWVNSLSEKAILKSDKFVESWGGYEALPNFLDYSDTTIRTSIMLPLQYGSRVFGVLTMEFKKYYRFSPELKEPLLMLANSVSRIFWVHYTSNQLLKDSKVAIKDIESHMKNDFSFLEKPKVFFSYPEKGDKKIVDAVIALFRERFSQFELVLWKENKVSGDIFKYIDKSIGMSIFGICYFTETHEEEGGFVYRNNPNVLMEAGMMQAYKSNKQNQFKNWIAIREDNDDPVPFNIANRNTLMVQRKPDGEPDFDVFEEDFCRYVEGIVDE